jgi:hypothetical protein
VNVADTVADTVVLAEMRGIVTIPPTTPPVVATMFERLAPAWKRTWGVAGQESSQDLDRRESLLKEKDRGDDAHN